MKHKTALLFVLLIFSFPYQNLMADDSSQIKIVEQKIDSLEKRINALEKSNHPQNISNITYHRPTVVAQENRQKEQNYDMAIKKEDKVVEEDVFDDEREEKETQLNVLRKSEDLSDTDEEEQNDSDDY